MKILFKTLQRPKNQLRMNEQADYQSDLLFHGLRSIYGANCIDIPKKDYMYDTYSKEMAGQLWGRGFTYSRTLEDIPIDRNVSPQDCDLVVFSVHHSVQFDYDYQIREYFNLGVSSDKIAVVDGHDWQQYNEKLAHVATHFFKRELKENTKYRLLPIWFAIPKEKIIDAPTEKKRDFARIYPGAVEWGPESRASHVFTKEEDYYREYQESRFAFTCKKGGWDCMRHLEILANGCVPIFTDIEVCPNLTCTQLSHQFLSKVKQSPHFTVEHTGYINNNTYCIPGQNIRFGTEKWTGTDEDWRLLITPFWAYKETWTTEYLANSFINRINRENGNR